MLKKHLPILIIIIFYIIVFGVSIFYFIQKDNVNLPVIPNNAQGEQNTQDTEASLNLPSEGNDTVITLKSDTTLRIVNEYDKNFFKAKKNLLIMFASWCPNCQAEISEIEKILKYYEQKKDINIVLIAHEYEDTVSDLISLLENDITFGKTEVKVDLKRIIRKTLDPEASTIPISYVVDNKGNVLDVFNDRITLEKAIDMLKK